MPYDSAALHSGVEGYLCATYSVMLGMNYKILKRVHLETMLIYNNVAAPFSGINNISSFGLAVGLRFDTKTDED